MDGFELGVGERLLDVLDLFGLQVGGATGWRDDDHPVAVVIEVDVKRTWSI